MKWMLIVYVLAYSTPAPTGYHVPAVFPTRADCEFWERKVPRPGKAIVIDTEGRSRIVAPIGAECRPLQQT